MKTHRIGQFLVFLMIAGCGTPQAAPTSTPSATAQLSPTLPPLVTPQSSPTLLPSATPTEEPLPVWDIVALGDSRTRRATWLETFAAYIKQDLGVEVNVLNWAFNGMPSEEILTSLRENVTLGEQVRQAELVTVFTNDLTGQEIFLFRRMLDDCPTKAYEEILEAIVREIFTFRGDQSTIFRLIENYNFPGVTDKAAAFFTAKIPCTMKYNAVVHRVAEKYSIPVAPLFKAFNGPNGDENPDDKGYLRDGVHTSPAGDQVIADLLQAIGYDMVPPPAPELLTPQPTETASSTTPAPAYPTP